MERRNFIQAVVAGSAASATLGAQSAIAATPTAASASLAGADGKTARAQLAALAQKMTEPVLTNMRPAR